jgi:hypothetical protein
MLTAQNELAAGSLKLIPCDGLELTRPLGIIQRRDATLSRAARSFVDLMMKNRIWDQERIKSSDSENSEDSPLEPYVDSKASSEAASTLAAG